jgi:hypothetical protein
MPWTSCWQTDKDSSRRCLLNGKEVIGPNEFSRNVQYIKKPVTLTEGNSLSVELRGKPGSGIRVVITGKNDEPQQFDFRDIIQPDGSNLLGSDLSYLWTILQKPENAQAVLDVVSSNPDLFVDLPGEYILELRIAAGSWESEPILVRLTATAGAVATKYDPFVPVPVKTRVVTGLGDLYQDYSIKIGSDTYTAPAPTSCGSPMNSGFQVLVLDRASLAKKDHKTFNLPCGRDAMTSFLGSLDNTSLVIASSLYSAAPIDLCGLLGGSLCPLLRDFGGTTVLATATPGSFILADGNTVNFSYSLIGIPHLGSFNGIELNNWDHKPLSLGDAKLLGEWSYSDLDKKDWEIIMRNALQAYYFQSLIPALWKIEYVDNTTIPNPTNYCYHASCSAYDTSSTGCECLPYCGDMNHPRAPESAYWVDQFPSGRYSWYVLEKGDWSFSGYRSKFGYASFSGATGLTDILFGQGDWLDTSGNRIGPKLNLSKPVFFERWLPPEACSRPQVPSSGIWNVTSCTCNH